MTLTVHDHSGRSVHLVRTITYYTSDHASTSSVRHGKDQNAHDKFDF